MFGCYRTGDAHDPETYVAAVIAVLSDYPTDIVEVVVDPRCGIPSKIKWLPTIAEIKSACEDIAGPRRRNAEWDRRAAEQLAERKLIEGETKPPQTYDEFKEEMSQRGLPIDNTSNRKRIADDVESIKARFGVSDAQWDAIPDGPNIGAWDQLVSKHSTAK